MKATYPVPVKSIWRHFAEPPKRNCQECNLGQLHPSLHPVHSVSRGREYSWGGKKQSVLPLFQKFLDFLLCFLGLETKSLRSLCLSRESRTLIGFFTRLAK